MVRKMILTAAVAMLVLPAMASAQSEVTATATVTPTAAVTGGGDVDFGPLSASVDNTIAADGGTVTRTLTYNHNLTVSFSNVPTALTSGTLTPLSVVLECAAQLGGTWSTPVQCDGGTIDLDVGAAQTIATLGFGGTILATNVANAAAGTYTASFDIVLTAR